MTDIDAALVSRLVEAQHPQWRDLPIREVELQGHDNRTFRLGDELSVRLPSDEGYVAAVAKEDAALRSLAGALPLPVPEVVALGEPGEGYLFPWSVRRWLPGTPLAIASDVDQLTLASDLGAWLSALRAHPAGDGPAAGRHSHHRGTHPSVYSDQVEAALVELAGEGVDADACRRIWLDATTSAWPAAPVWCHGDVAPGNLLTVDGRLSAVIDFGGCAVGDPACDLVMAWTWFDRDARRAFSDAVGLDDDTWRRSRGWAMWKALIQIAGSLAGDPDGEQRRILATVLQDALD